MKEGCRELVVAKCWATLYWTLGVGIFYNYFYNNLEEYVIPSIQERSVNRSAGYLDWGTQIHKSLAPFTEFEHMMHDMMNVPLSP